MLANENALDSIYRTFIALNRLVEDDTEADTRTAKEKAAELNEKVQELVFSALRSLTSEDAQRNLSLLLGQRKAYTDFTLSKSMLVGCDNRHPLKSTKKLSVNLTNIRKICYPFNKIPPPPTQKLQ